MSNNKYIRSKSQRDPRDTYYKCTVSVNKETIDQEEFVHDINEVFDPNKYKEAEVKVYFVEGDRNLTANIFIAYLRHRSYITLSYGKLRKELESKLPTYETGGKIIKPYIRIESILDEDYKQDIENLDKRVDSH